MPVTVTVTVTLTLTDSHIPIFSYSHIPIFTLDRAPELLQIRLDEGIEIAIHYLLHVRDLQVRAMIVHHGIRLKDVRPDLAAPGNIRLGGFDLGLFGFLL